MHLIRKNRPLILTGKIKKLLPVLGLISVSSVAQESDLRETVMLTENQRAHVLMEMRNLLSGTQTILAALAEDDMSVVAAEAKKLGMNMGHKAENSLHKELPVEFMQLGMSLHRDFDIIAADAEMFKDARHTLKQLSDTMVTCQSCHAVYRLDVRQVTINPSKFKKIIDADRIN